MNRNKQSNILGGVITLIILILLIFLSNMKLNKLSFLEGIVNSVVAPVQRVVTDLANKIQGNSAYFADIQSLQTLSTKRKKMMRQKERFLRLSEERLR